MFGLFNRIQTRIFAFFVILLVAVQAISFSITFYANKRLEQEQLKNQRSVAELVFKSEIITSRPSRKLRPKTSASKISLSMATDAASWWH